jgi:UPF0755 protein
MTKQQQRCYLISLILICLILLSLVVYGPLFFSTRSELLEIKNGESLSKVLLNTQTLGMISIVPDSFVKGYFYLSDSETKIQAGFYRLPPLLSLAELKKQLSQGLVERACFTIRPGSQTNQVIAELEQEASLRDKTRLKARWTNYLAKEGKGYEGQLLAETFCFNVGESAFTLLKRSHHYLKKRLEQKAQSAANPLKLSNQERLIIASLIEKESANQAEMPVISSVIYNRLQKKMYLQIDSSVLYGLGLRQFGEGVKQKLAIKTPYNTYRRKGLPIGPIAVVGGDALDAAFRPSQTNFYYFVLDNETGRHRFSEYYHLHVANINRNQQKPTLKRN